METKEKFAALDCLATCSIKMDVNSRFYCMCESVKVADDGVLIGETGRGDTPYDAIDDYWNKLISVEYPKRIIIDAMREEKRREVLWTGYMWKDI